MEKMTQVGMTRYGELLTVGDLFNDVNRIFDLIPTEENRKIAVSVVQALYEERAKTDISLMAKLTLLKPANELAFQSSAKLSNVQKEILREDSFLFAFVSDIPADTILDTMDIEGKAIRFIKDQSIKIIVKALEVSCGKALANIMDSNPFYDYMAMGYDTMNEQYTKYSQYEHAMKMAKENKGRFFSGDNIPFRVVDKYYDGVPIFNGDSESIDELLNKEKPTQTIKTIRFPRQNNNGGIKGNHHQNNKFND